MLDILDMWTNLHDEPYSIRRQTWKWIKKLFFHFIDLTNLPFITLATCEPKLLHRSNYVSEAPNT
jgi:hypothetical protein